MHAAARWIASVIGAWVCVVAFTGCGLCRIAGPFWTAMPVNTGGARTRRAMTFGSAQTGTDFACAFSLANRTCEFVEPHKIVTPDREIAVSAAARKRGARDRAFGVGSAMIEFG